MSMILAVKPELDDMADRFGIPRLRGFKTSTRSIGSMGDGIMTLHPDYFSGYAANIGRGASGASLRELESQVQGLRTTLAGYKTQLEKINSDLRAAARNSPEFDRLWKARSEIIISYNKLAGEVNQNVKKIQIAKRSAVEPSTWKVGDNPSLRPHGVENYMTSGVDKARAVLYHEFGHHVHQTYKKTVSRLKELPPIEIKLKSLWSKKTAAEKALQASKYATTNEKEWFAENFALYMMGKRQLVDRDLIKLIEEMLNEQSIR